MLSIEEARPLMFALFKACAMQDEAGVNAIMDSLGNVADCHLLILCCAAWANDVACVRIIADVLHGETVLSDEELDKYAIAMWVAQLDEALEGNTRGEIAP